MLLWKKTNKQTKKKAVLNEMKCQNIRRKTERGKSQQETPYSDNTKPVTDKLNYSIQYAWPRSALALIRWKEMLLHRQGAVSMHHCHPF